MEKNIEDLKVKNDQEITQTEASSSNGKEWIEGVLELFACISLFASIIAAFVFGFQDTGVYYTHTEFNAPVFFGLLLSGFLEFLLLNSMCIIVKAANKYLNSNSSETDKTK